MLSESAYEYIGTIMYITNNTSMGFIRFLDTFSYVLTFQNIISAYQHVLHAQPIPSRVTIASCGVMAYWAVRDFYKNRK